jgi:cytochrome d ubiquinol oxidase subunit II
MSVAVDLATLWAFIIAFAVFAYVVLDGFDLGVALLFPLFKERRDRDVMMNSVAPVWDGNETWLVLGGGGLFAAFPLAYSILFPAIFTPVIAMLLGLVFRGVAFEFRWQTNRGRFLWDIAFFGGSFIAALSQGIALGAILQGVKVTGRAYGGGWWDWLTPFTILTGVAVVVGYALLGACWLVMKTEGDLRDRAYRLARFAVIATLFFIVAVSLATPFLEEAYWQRWFAWPGILITAPVPVAVALVAFFLFRSIDRQRDYQPFFLALVLFLLCFVGLGVSMWPHIVPGAVTIWQAAAPAASQKFLLFGVAILIPMILAYTGYAYWVFRGKVDPEVGYH